jgi:hypothetical protein
MVSITDREANALRGVRREDATALSCFARQLIELGLMIEEFRQVRAEDVERLSSTWMKRLGIPRLRPAWLLRASKPEPPEKSRHRAVAIDM